MENKQKTAIEWLEAEFLKLEETVGVHGVMYELIEKAKEMEKDQIIAAHGRKTTITDVNGTNLYGIKTGQEYFNETYGK
jgi:hypothetical protein